MGLWDKIKRTLKGFLNASAEKKARPRRRKSVRVFIKSKTLQRKVKDEIKKARPSKKSKKIEKSKKSNVKKTVSKPENKNKTPRRLNSSKPAFKKSAKTSKKDLGEFVGEVTHYFPQVNVAALKIQKRGLMIGEQISILGHTTKFKTIIESMQINRKPVINAVIGDEIGIKVPRRVRAGDKVFFQAK